MDKAPPENSLANHLFIDHRDGVWLVCLGEVHATDHEARLALRGVWSEFCVMVGSDINATEEPCRGCGKPLVVEDAWMEDGCSCNTPAGINNHNLYRWKLLHDLQQRQSCEITALRAQLKEAQRPTVENQQFIAAMRAQLAAANEQKELAAAMVVREAADCFEGTIQSEWQSGTVDHNEIPWSLAAKHKILELSSAATLAKLDGLVRDAGRWNRLRLNTGAEQIGAMYRFVLPEWLTKKRHSNLLKGSVAEWLDETADDAIHNAKAAAIDAARRQA